MGKTFRYLAVIVLMAGFAPSAMAQQRVLDRIVPVRQATHVWCWLAVGEMVFRHYGIQPVNFSPNDGAYQCGIVGSLAYNPPQMHPCTVDCRYCTVPAGDARGMQRMLDLYPIRAGSPALTSTYYASAMSMRDIMREIDTGNPVIIGISPSGRPPFYASEHVALIAGYDLGRNAVLVHDPYPFDGGWADPYLRAGAQRVGDLSYWVRLDMLLGPLQWRETFTVRYRARSMPRYCCNAHGRFGPYENPVSTHPGTGLGLGEACMARTQFGNMIGAVCQ